MNTYRNATMELAISREMLVAVMNRAQLNFLRSMYPMTKKPTKLPGTAASRLPG